jgi:hypothetical protein
VAERFLGEGLPSFNDLQLKVAWRGPGGQRLATEDASSLLLHEPSSGVTVAVAMNQSPGSHGSSHFPLASELLRLSRE